jgi:hypothetical protein
MSRRVSDGKNLLFKFMRVSAGESLCSCLDKSLMVRIMLFKFMRVSACESYCVHAYTSLC